MPSPTHSFTNTRFSQGKYTVLTKCKPSLRFHIPFTKHARYFHFPKHLQYDLHIVFYVL